MAAIFPVDPGPAPPSNEGVDHKDGLATRQSEHSDSFRVADHTPQEEVCGWGSVLLVFGDVHHKLRLTTASAVCSEYQFRFITFIAEEWP